ncbi:MAG: hypothetical protein LC679_13735 [Intrasporangiaceae bacterium]|nr:hypothetical protein [Intrasporangiaceae bacterium]
MTSTPPVPFDPSRLRVGADLRRLAIEPARAGWHCVRRGVWVPAQVWSSLNLDQRHQAFVHATVLACRDEDGLVLASHSAAAIWGLPRIEAWPRQVSVLDPQGVMGGSRYVRPRCAAPAQPVLVRGVHVTPVARTVVDLACTGTLDTALAAADHALRRGLCTRADLESEVVLLPPGARGRVTARLMVDLADGDSDSAGESLSRLQMFRANLPRPVLQEEFRDGAGLIGVTDFAWEGLIGEFDGRLKYRVPPDATPEEAGEIVWREKKREDRLRRQRPVARWTWATARNTAVLARHLIGHGLRAEPRSRWIDLGGAARRIS